MFPFRNLPIEKFAEDKKFQAHCANIVYTLGAIIENLDNTDVLVEMLKKSGETHGRRKVPEKAYWVSKHAILHHIIVISRFSCNIKFSEIKHVCYYCVFYF